MKTALFPGSFDPITNGHMDVIHTALGLVDRLVIAIGTHAGKKPVFSFEQRMELIDATLSAGQRSKVEIVSFNGLVIEAARDHEASVLLRGLRDGNDFAYEMQMAGMNGDMAAEIATVFIPATPQTRHISATLVRQIAAMKGDVGAFVSPPVEKALTEHFS